MEIYEIILAILDKPNVPKFYKKLRDFYQKHNMHAEASALNHLVQEKFEKNA